MAVIHFDGFDHDRVSEGITREVADLRYVTGRGGRGKAVQFGSADGYNSHRSWLHVEIPAPTAGFACACAYRAMHGEDGTRFFEWREGATVHLGLDTLEGSIRLVRGDGAVLATSAVPVNVTNASFTHLEAQGVIGDAGSFKLWANGEVVIDFTGDTKNGGAGLLSRWSIGGINVLSAIVYNDGTQLDDLWITDTTGDAPNNGRLGNAVVEHVYPNGQGDANQWVGSDGDSTDNWALLDDQDGADYIQSGTPGDRDLSHVTNSDPTLGQVLAVAVDVLAATSQTGTAIGPVREVIKAGTGTEYEEVVASVGRLTTTPAWFRGSVRNTDPDGAPWTTAKANAMQVGVEVGVAT